MSVPREPRDAGQVGLVGVSKRYGGTVALQDVTVEFACGEIVGLVGKNGAGKSSLIKVLAGAVSPDRGEVQVDGRRVNLRSPRDATKLGISVVHQELALVPGLSVAENVWLGLGYPRRGRTLVSRRRLDDQAREILAQVGVPGDPSALAAGLDVAAQRLVMIARGLAARARLLVLDEPSASFSDQEVQRLHSVVRALADGGVGVVYVSHRVGEILSLTDRVIVMRGGAVVDRAATTTLDHATLIDRISGGVTGGVRSSARAARRQPGPEVLRAAHLRGGRDQRVRDASVTVREGEVVGIAGLVGAGRTELARMLFGCEQPTSGQLFIGGREVRLRSPQDAVRRGIALVPEDRRREGSVVQFSVRKNMTLPSLGRFRRWARVAIPHQGREQASTQAMVGDLGITLRGVDTVVDTLSGGNQQKVVVGKWLLRDAALFIFDEPSIGIDVQAKAEMFRRIELLASAGKAVIVICSEFNELEEVCDRVVVMREGITLGGELIGDEINEENMLRLCYGHGGADDAAVVGGPGGWFGRASAI
jgi:ribose transport system ATP-binding protein